MTWLAGAYAAIGSGDVIQQGGGHIFLRVATLVAVASATAASGLAAPDAHADPLLDQQFLDMVHSGRHSTGEEVSRCQ